jgi:hypothetical protein
MPACVLVTMDVVALRLDSFVANRRVLMAEVLLVMQSAPNLALRIEEIIYNTEGQKT